MFSRRLPAVLAALLLASAVGLPALAASTVDSEPPAGIPEEDGAVVWIPLPLPGYFLQIPVGIRLTSNAVQTAPAPAGSSAAPSLPNGVHTDLGPPRWGQLVNTVGGAAVSVRYFSE